MKLLWNKIEWLLSFNELKSSLLNLEYSDKNAEGFIIDKAQTNIIVGRYILKSDLTETIITPNGTKEEIKRTNYIHYNFSINYDKTLSLSLIDPPRAISKFGLALNKATKNRLIIHPINIKPGEWLTQISNQLKDITIRRIDATQIPLKDNINASIILRGNSGLLAELGKISNSSKGKVTRIDFSFRSDDGDHQVTITNSGSFTIKDIHIKDTIEPILFDCLNSLLN